ncbi:uncharacterized protein LOC110882424 isoform X2 [Helianthus annuus]|uniref:uncharacterized protein LOC110882424 isoform X2 n=1 Tax=Helianthus annuus TaxID=4232 RepID=UPI000B8F8E79|nr:uncharacterized protein LOC110882424 isoform X2 [Helianthus annuus]
MFLAFKIDKQIKAIRMFCLILSKLLISKHNVGGSPVSIFSLTGSNAGDGRLAAGLKRLTTVRHPNILSFLHSTKAEVIDGFSAKLTVYCHSTCYATCGKKIKELGLQGTQRYRLISS